MRFDERIVDGNSNTMKPARGKDITMFRHAFFKEIEWKSVQEVEIHGQTFRLHIDFEDEVPGRIELTDLDDRRPRQLSINLPDVFVIQRDDGHEVRRYRSWCGSHMGKVRDDPYLYPNGTLSVTYYPAHLALRGDKNLERRQDDGGLKRIEDVLANMQSVVSGYPAPPWMYAPLLFVQYRAGDAVAYTPAEWHESTKRIDCHTALVWAVTMAEARAVFDTFYRACLDAVGGRIDWTVVSDQVQAIT